MNPQPRPPAGDGCFAIFDGPARAMRCAAAMVAGLQGLGISVRAGLHSGEVEILGDKVGRHRRGSVRVRRTIN